MAAIRYRRGIDRRSGRVVAGWAHVAQSLEVIWTTRIGSRVMRLDFGSNHFGLLSEDLTPALALQLYDSLVTAAHAFEPEYRIRELQLVSLTREGALGIRHRGRYYPEGRLGNYDLFADQAATASFARLAQIARSGVAG
ncbi:GPW/gp25 family protein [Methylopila sp. M107]|uniref:GPW/gp25 family protein n=1 Tax=Methylopila sp. M107 TaxID=1101190 RepID=UPI00035C775F|nr:GPW/gp25 family protein [Methylopila sp. M107]